ncbi:MAG: hypothetical protein PHU14_04490, partial [Methylovulum sp.]|nr:hypothetical protein [Methylovulum sp.]
YQKHIQPIVFNGGIKVNLLVCPWRGYDSGIFHNETLCFIITKPEIGPLNESAFIFAMIGVIQD